MPGPGGALGGGAGGNGGRGGGASGTGWWEGVASGKRRVWGGASGNGVRGGWGLGPWGPAPGAPCLWCPRAGAWEHPLRSAHGGRLVPRRQVFSLPAALLPPAQALRSSPVS